MNTIKKISIATLCVLVTACVTPKPKSADLKSEDLNESMRTGCIDGVEYIFFKGQAGYSGWGYMSVKFNRDGSVSTCEG